MFRFKLLHGIHVGDKYEYDADGNVMRGEDGNPVKGEHIWRANEPGNNIIETHLDLATKFNGVGMPPNAQKFERLQDSPAQKPLPRAGGPKAPSTLAKPPADVLKSEVTTEVATKPKVPDEAEDDNFDDMTVPELKAWAEDHEVPLTGVHKRDDIIETLRKNR